MTCGLSPKMCSQRNSERKTRRLAEPTAVAIHCIGLDFGEVSTPNIGASSRIDDHRWRRPWSATHCGDLVNPVLEDVQGTGYNVGGPPDGENSWVGSKLAIKVGAATHASELEP